MLKVILLSIEELGRNWESPTWSANIIYFISDIKALEIETTFLYRKNNLQ